MEPFYNETRTSYRALLSNAQECMALGEEAEVITTRWYDEEPPMDQLIEKAKEKNKDVITIEIQTIEQRSYEVK